VVRGANVFDGYEGPPEGNAGVFREGWFRTGDLGRFDEDGYLFLHGRVKDLINRGGQKVSPHEVEAVLRAHPGVREAVVFPVPHASLGESVAAAVVPAPGPPSGEGALRRFLADRLAPFKVPLRILVVPEIPKGATGKAQRHALAEALQAALAQAPGAAPEPVAVEAAPEAWAEAAATEAVLWRHPAVLRCAVLPKTDALGQRHLAAYVVVSRDTPHEDFMLFLMQEAPDCVVPSAYVDLDAMPWTPEGQVDRRRLEALPVSLLQARKPRETAELILARLWEDILKTRPGALSDDFFQQGGDSLKAVELLMRIEGELGVAILPEAFFQRPTLGSLVQALDRQDGPAPVSALLRVQAGAGARPFFFVHGDFNGGGFHCLRLARLLGAERPFYTFQPHGFPGQPPPTSLPAMAEHYLPLLRQAQPSGPYFLGGHCNGALVAFELAQALRGAGEAVALLALVAPPPAKLFGTEAGRAALIPSHVEIRKQSTMVRRAILAELYTHAVLSYAPRHFPGKVQLLATGDDFDKGGPDLGWGPLAGELEVQALPGDHHSVLTHHLEELAARLRLLLEPADPVSGGSAG
jgi:thioesterase domain-containing protein/acyl carrier protein